MVWPVGSVMHSANSVAFPQSLAPGSMRRLMREVATLRTSPPDGVRIVTSEEDMLDIVGIIAGPGEPIAGSSAGPFIC